MIWNYLTKVLLMYYWKGQSIEDWYSFHMILERSRFLNRYFLVGDWQDEVKKVLELFLRDYLIELTILMRWYYWFGSDHQLENEIMMIEDNNLIFNLPDLNVNELLINVRVSIVVLNVILVKVDNCFESQWTIIGLSRLSQEHISHT